MKKEDTEKITNNLVKQSERIDKKTARYEVPDLMFNENKPKNEGKIEENNDDGKQEDEPTK